MNFLIAGLAKTGTTGLLYRIADCVSDPKRLIFEPKSYRENPGDPKMNILCKILIGPDLDVNSFRGFYKKVTIIRDPRDRMVSSMLYSQFHCNYAMDNAKVKMIRRLLEQKEKDPKSIPFLHIVDIMGQANNANNDHVGNFFRHAMAQEEWLDNYLSQIGDAYILRYEDFVAGRLDGLEEYLGVKLSQSGEVPTRFQRVVRTRGAGDWKNWFTRSDIDKISQLYNSILLRYNYDLKWENGHEQIINPEHCSEYYMRLIEERRRIDNGNTSQGSRKIIKPASDTTEYVAKVGNIDRVEGNRITGWAVGNDFSTPAKLRISVNGKDSYTIIANKFRQDLFEKALHPTGKCGFQLIIEPDRTLRDGDIITVEGISENLSIRRSPYVVNSLGKEHR